LNPGVGISTKEAYVNCSPEKPLLSLAELILKPVSEWRNLIFNDFEKFAFSKHRIIGTLKDELYRSGALFSLMSGSGSSVFGVFSSRPELPPTVKKYRIFEGWM
jgi:4-diphosphocytidyl-2-C-methyl-D-erythritol kinase